MNKNQFNQNKALAEITQSWLTSLNALATKANEIPLHKELSAKDLVTLTRLIGYATSSPEVIKMLNSIE